MTEWNHLWKFYHAVKTTNMFINSLTLILFHISVSIITSYTQLEQRFNHPQSALTYLHTCFLLLPNKVNSTQRFSAILLFITKCHTDCLALFYNIGCNIPKIIFVFQEVFEMSFKTSNNLTIMRRAHG